MSTLMDTTISRKNKHSQRDLPAVLRPRSGPPASFGNRGSVWHTAGGRTKVFKTIRFFARTGSFLVFFAHEPAFHPNQLRSGHGAGAMGPGRSADPRPRRASACRDRPRRALERHAFPIRRITLTRTWNLGRSSTGRVLHLFAKRKPYVCCA